jgi:hypothetical protein
MKLNLSPEKLKRNQAFINMEEIDRPLFGSWLFGYYVHTNYPHMHEVLVPGPIQPDDIPIDRYLEDVDALNEAYLDLDDDIPFSTGAFYAVPWMEAIMGCNVHYTGTNMYAEPCIESWDEYDWQVPKLENNPWFQKLLEILDGVITHSKGRYACGPTLMRGVADIASAMRGGSNLAMDTIDCPDHLRKLAEICSEVWIETGNAQLDLVPESENGYMVGIAGLRVWMPEKGIWLQDDAVSVLSPKSYTDIYAPFVKQIASEFSMLAFHLHGNQLWPVDVLLDIEEIELLELNYDVGVCDLDEVIAGWKKIQAKKPCLAYADLRPEELDEVLDQLDPKGLSVQTLAETMEEAKIKRDLVYRRSKN